MDIFQHLVLELDTEGRYLFLNAVANQLRYPNNHTHYFSCVLLYLFAEANLVSSPLPHCFHGFYIRHCSSLTTMIVWKLLSLRLNTGLCWRSHLTAIPPKAPHFVINMLILACSFSGNYTGANHKGVAGETDCKSTASLGSSHHLHWANQGSSWVYLVLYIEYPVLSQGSGCFWSKSQQQLVHEKYLCVTHQSARVLLGVVHLSHLGLAGLCRIHGTAFGPIVLLAVHRR